MANLTNLNNKFLVTTGGNVGINTTSPTQKLVVIGNIYTSGSVLFDDNQGINFGNSNAKIYGSSADGIKFNGGGSEAMRLDQSGNLGIGKIATEKLDVEGNIQAIKTGGSSVAYVDIVSGATWRFASNPTSGTNAYGLNIIKGSAGTDVKMSIDTNGNVGIGTSSPLDKVHSVGGYLSTNLANPSNTNTGSVQLGYDGTRGILRTWNSSPLQLNAYNNIEFHTSGSERMRITSGGDVGIGTTSPNHKLDIYSNENVPLRIHRPSNANLNSSGAWGIGFSTRGDAITSTTDTRSGIFSYYNGNLFFATNTSSIVADPDASARMTILNTGYVGINTTNPLNQFDLRGAAYISGYTVGFDTTPQGNYAYRLTNDGGNSFINVQGGNLGIGETSPDKLLHLKSSGATGIAIESTTNAQNLDIDFYNNAGAAAGRIRYEEGTGAFAISSSIASPNAMYITNGNLIGIGTTSPLGKLMVQDDTAGSPTRIIVSNGGTAQSGTAARLSFYEGTTEKNYIERRRDGSGHFAFKSPADDNPFVWENASGEFMRFTNSNVGIGETSPDSKLHVKGDMVTIEDPSGGFKMELSADADPVTIMSDNLTGAAYGQIVLTSGNGSGSNDQERMRIDSAGNVGIGITPTASSKLNIGGLNSGYFVDLTCSGPGGSRAIRFIDGGTPTKYNWLVGAQHNVDNAFEITASTAVGGTTFNSPLFLVNQSGKVGIGTTAPQTPLHVNGGLGETIRVQGSSATGKNYIQFADSAGNIDAYIGLGSSTTDKFLIVNFTDEPTQFYQKNGIKMTITNVGDVGIGKTNPSTHLDVQGVITCGDSTTDGAIRRQHQTFATMKPGPSSGGNVDMMFVDHTHTLDVTVMAYINTSTVAVARGYSSAAYGSASAGFTQTNFSPNGTISAISLSYVNSGGSEAYILRVNVTYTGSTAPVISMTANGQSTSELRAAT